MARAKMVSVRSVNAALRRAGVDGGVRSKVLDTVRGEERLPAISKNHVKQLKLDLKEHGIAALSLSGSGKVRMIRPSRIKLKDERLKHLKKLAEGRRKKKK